MFNGLIINGGTHIHVLLIALYIYVLELQIAFITQFDVLEGSIIYVERQLQRFVLAMYYYVV